MTLIDFTSRPSFFQSPCVRTSCDLVYINLTGKRRPGLPELTAKLSVGSDSVTLVGSTHHRHHPDHDQMQRSDGIARTSAFIFQSSSRTFTSTAHTEVIMTRWSNVVHQQRVWQRVRWHEWDDSALSDVREALGRFQHGFQGFVETWLWISPSSMAYQASKGVMISMVEEACFNVVVYCVGKGREYVSRSAPP
jgi:hypothetical protein